MLLQVQGSSFLVTMIKETTSALGRLGRFGRPLALGRGIRDGRGRAGRLRRLGRGHIAGRFRRLGAWGVGKRRSHAGPGAGGARRVAGGLGGLARLEDVVATLEFSFTGKSVVTSLFLIEVAPGTSGHLATLD